VVVADHGEGFGEHGQTWEHNDTISDDVVHVPLIVKLPAGAAKGARVTDLVRTYDLAPTILELTGAPALADIQGRSFVSLLDGGQQSRSDTGALSAQTVLLEAGREAQVMPLQYSWIGLRSLRYKLVVRYGTGNQEPHRFLFDLASDPGETTPMNPAPQDTLDAFTRRALSDYQNLASLAGDGSRRGIDQMTSEALRSLGYIH
jgi:arylsulfatase A-like enzyme